MSLVPHWSEDTITLYHGDCLEVLAALPESSIDAVVCDPPYGISFMGKAWDQPLAYGSLRRNGNPGVHRRGPQRSDDQIGDTGAMDAGTYDLSPHAMRQFQSWCEAWSSECLRVLKPGGHILAFGGSRTWHRLASGIENAGFEIRDSIAWLYGSGFPKSLDVSKSIDRAAGAEREVLAEGAPVKRLIPGADQNRSGSWIKDNGREYVPTETAPATEAAKQWQGWGTALKPSFEPIVVGRKPLSGTVAANVLEHGTGALNIDGCRVAGDNSATINRRKGSTTHLSDRSAREAEAAGKIESRTSPERYREERPGELIGRWPTNVLIDEQQAEELNRQSGTLTSAMRAGTERQPRTGGTIYGADARTFTPADTYGDSGGASRFFPTFRYSAKAPTAERPTVNGVAHPTVKPLELMRWLIRLVTPPGGTVLDPFAGSGTTGEAAIHEHKRAILIEREATYLPLIVGRLSKPMAVGFNFDEVDDD